LSNNKYLGNKSKTNSVNNLNNNDSGASLAINKQNSKNMISNEKIGIIQNKDIKTPKNNLKDEYKQIVKDKNYSRSIDGNIPKTKYSQYQINNIPVTDSNANNTAKKISFNFNLNNTKPKK